MARSLIAGFLSLEEEKAMRGEEKGTMGILARRCLSRTREAWIKGFWFSKRSGHGVLLLGFSAPLAPLLVPWVVS